MKKAIPYLLLFALLYGGWWYWQQQPRPPLRARLLPHTAEAIDRISLWPLEENKYRAFEISRLDGAGWVVENNQRSLTGQREKVEQLLAALLEMESRGLATLAMISGKPLLNLRLNGGRTGEVDEELTFYPAPDSLPTTTLLLRLNGLSDLYRIDDFPLANLATNFNDYRNPLLIDLGIFNRLDSLVWWRAKDSTRLKLLDGPAGDSLVLDSLQTAWSPRLEKHYADYFAEIRDQGLLEGRYFFFGTSAMDSVVLSVYANPRWPRPNVVKGNALEYFALDELPWGLPSE